MDRLVFCGLTKPQFADKIEANKRKSILRRASGNSNSYQSLAELLLSARSLGQGISSLDPFYGGIKFAPEFLPMKSPLLTRVPEEWTNGRNF